MFNFHVEDWVTFFVSELKVYVHNGIDLSNSGLKFQVRGKHSVPDIIHEPSKSLIDFKLTPRVIRPKQSKNSKSDFPGYVMEYIFGS